MEEREKMKTKLIVVIGIISLLTWLGINTLNSGKNVIEKHQNKLELVYN